VQVDPIKTTLKAPGTKRLKLNCAEPLSNIAFSFNLRRYIGAFDAASDRVLVMDVARQGGLPHLRASI